MKRLSSAQPQENEYYARISRKLKNAKYLSVMLLVIFAFLTLFAYRDNLTYENLRYLLRDVDAAGHAELVGDTVYYAADENNTFLYFRDDLAVGSGSGITFHRALGSRSFSDEISFVSPLLYGSDKYMIAHDAGGQNFYVYNSLGRVYDEKLDTEIISAAAADDGHFAVLAKNKTGGADVTVYDKNFKKVATLTRRGEPYVIGFLDDGRLYICESAVEDAALYTDVSFYTVGESDTHGAFRESGLVIELGSIKKGFYALTHRSVVFFDADGERVSSHSFGTADILYSDAWGDSVAVLLKENTSGEQCGAYMYSADGETVSYKVQKGAKGISLCKDRICILYEGKLVVYGETVNDTEIPTGARRMLTKDSGSVIVCYNDYAKIFSVK